MSKHKRAILKAISWRLIGTLSTIILFYIMTGDMSIGLSFGGIDVTIKFILYYLHERLWDNSKSGQKKDT